MSPLPSPVPVFVREPYPADSSLYFNTLEARYTVYTTVMMKDMMENAIDVASAVFPLKE